MLMSVQGGRKNDDPRKHDTSKEHNSSFDIDCYLKEMYEIPEKEFKIMILQELNEMQENTDSSKKWNKMPNINKKFNK